ncbi:MAG: oxidoreductase, partial [Rhodobacteraceae bacterium]|nr:oxidoreductase [Paracoccaceae bacterium]
RQRGRTAEPQLPGLAHGNVWSPEDVMRREARLGNSVILYDEGGNWRGLGTAWALAEQGKRLTIVTPAAFLGQEIARTSADAPLRARLARAGARFLPESLIARWHGNGATIRSLLTSVEETVPASALVMSTTNIAFDPFPEQIPGKATHRIGDCVAPRLAPYAFHEGRKLALFL